ILFLGCLLWAAVSLPAQSVLLYGQSQPAEPQSPQSQSPPSQSGSAPPSGATPQQPSKENGTFVIRKDVDEVLLHATVVDDKQHIVTDLDRTAFTIFEDGKQQNV